MAAPPHPPVTKTADISGVRAMAGAFDRLVRSSRQQGTSLEDLAHRVIDIWRQEKAAQLVLWPTRLAVAEEDVLQLDGEQGRWILPAFMAGVRGLAISSTVNVDDALALAVELSELTATQASIESFQNWLWSDGAEGFEVSVVPSFVEVMDVETSAAALANSGPLETARSSGLFSVGGQRITSAELDLAKVREEFDVPLVSYRAAARQEAFRHNPERLDQFRADLEDPARQLEIEIDAALAQAWLRDTIDAKRLARRFEAHLVRPLSERALRLLEALFDSQDEYFQAVATQLGRPGFAEVLARAFDPDAGPIGVRFAGVLQRLEPPSRKRAIMTLLEACAEDLDRFEGLRQWCELIDFQFIQKAVEGELIRPKVAKVLARIVLSGSPSMAVFDSVISTLPAMAAVAAMSELPAASHEQLADRIGALAAEPSEEVVSRVVTLIGPNPPVAVLDALGKSLRRSADGRWPMAAAYRVCRLLVERGMGRSHVVPVVRVRTASSTVRKAALQSLSSAPELRDEATRFRVSELLDPPDLRKRIRRSRKVGKDSES